MAIINRLAQFHDEITAWRRQLHAMPELDFDLFKTTELVEQKLTEFGCDEIHTGIAKTGIVAIIKGDRGGSEKTIGLRSDMDALPIAEQSGKDWVSHHDGKMHACGHDGHMAMLLGAARYLAETRNFSGKVALIFQPAEEGAGGGRVMVEEKIMERFGIDEVYGMHNLPGLGIGQFAMRDGAIMASTDEFNIMVKGKGGHAAQPHRGLDPIVVVSQMVTALQTIVSRNVDPVEAVVLSITQIHAGNSHNIIPETAKLNGTVRTLKPEMRDFVEKRIGEIIAGIATAGGLEAEFDYHRNYPVTVNHSKQTQNAQKAAIEIAGKQNVDADTAPMMGAEDFSYMLERRPGAFIFVGNGDSANLHHPKYDFNDEAIPYGSSYWVKLVETLLAA